MLKIIYEPDGGMAQHKNFNEQNKEFNPKTVNGARQRYGKTKKQIKEEEKALAKKLFQDVEAKNKLALKLLNDV